MYNRIYNEDDWKNVNKKNKSIMEDYLLEYTARKKKKTTIQQYRNDIRIILIYILKHCDNKDITELSKRDFRNLSLWLSDELELSNARTNRLMSCCRSLLTYVEEDDEYEYENNVSRKIKGLPKESVRNIVFLTDDIISKLRTKLLYDERYKEATLLSLLYDSACRKNECAQVEKYSFLEDDRNSTNPVVGKRGKIFNLIYFNMTIYCARLYLEERGDDDIDSLWVLGKGENKRPAKASNLYDWVVSWRKDLKEITGQDYKINCHSFRHSALENMSTGEHYICKELGLGAIPLEKLKLIANHSDLSTTASYLLDKSTQELENLFNIKI